MKYLQNQALTVGTLAALDQRKSLSILITLR